MYGALTMKFEVFRRLKHGKEKNNIQFFFSIFDFCISISYASSNQVHTKGLEINFKTNYSVCYSCKQLNLLSLFKVIVPEKHHWGGSIKLIYVSKKIGFTRNMFYYLLMYLHQDRHYHHLRHHQLPHPLSSCLLGSTKDVKDFRNIKLLPVKLTNNYFVT